MTTPTARAAGGPADGGGKITRDAVLAAALDILERGLDILLTGLTTTLTPSRPGLPARGETTAPR